MIFRAERECSDIEEEIDNLKGTFNFIKIKKLQNQINLKNESIDNLKNELLSILKRSGFRSMPSFYKAYNKSSSDYIYYQEQAEKWEEIYGEKEKS